MAPSSTKLFRPLFIGEWIARSEKQPRDIAVAVGVTEAYMSELISGRKKNPSAQLLLAISEELGVTVNDLYRKPPSAATLEKLGNLSPIDAALLSRMLEQAKAGK